MDIRDQPQSPMVVEPRARPAAAPDVPADPVAARLEVIIGRSRRRAPLRRALRRMGRAFARWADGLVPPVPNNEADPPPEIRFPFF
jgi:hypothetical protein